MLKRFDNILDEVLQETKHEINPSDLIDVFDFYTKIRHKYYRKATKYLVNIVIPYIIERNCDPALLSKKSTKTVDKVIYDLLDSHLRRSGFHQNYTIKDMLLSLYQDIEPKLVSYISDPTKMNLSEKVHSIFFEILSIPYKKLSSKGKEKVHFGEVGGQLSMDYVLRGSYVSTNKILQGTGRSDEHAITDFMLSIKGFKKYQERNSVNLTYKCLICILDFPTENLRYTTADWNKSHISKIKLIEQLNKEAGICLNKTIFIGRFKDLYNRGCFS